MIFIVIILLLVSSYYLYQSQNKPKPGEKLFKPGGTLGNIKLTIDNNFVKYRGAYGDSAVIPIKNISSITTSPNGAGSSDVIFVGNGAELARINKLPASWAEKTMIWLINELKL